MVYCLKNRHPERGWAHHWCDPSEVKDRFIETVTLNHAILRFAQNDDNLKVASVTKPILSCS